MKHKLLSVVVGLILLIGYSVSKVKPVPSSPKSLPSTTQAVEKEVSGEKQTSLQPAIPISQPCLPQSTAANHSLSAEKLLFPKKVPLGSDYVEQIADELLEQIIEPEMDDITRLRTVYNYLIANTYFADPVGLDVWQWRGHEQEPPCYLENRAISPILFGIGTCEDYAAAMAVLAMRMGYPAQYVFGMTVSVTGQYVDHAWTVVRLDGKWYHIDPQLEDNIVRNSRVQNRYFMRCDAAMLTDHRWGENLIEYRRDLSDSTREYIRKELTPPICNGETPPAAPYLLQQLPKPDRNGIIALLKKEKAQYERNYGALPKVTLNITPPLEINP